MKEALKLALEALEELVEFVPLLRPTCLGDERAIGHRIDRATTAIIAAKEALAQPEPVAFPNRRAVEREIERIQNPKGMHLNDGKERVILPGGTLRYLLALADRSTSPQRPWVGLTGQEKALIASVSLDVHDAVHRTEAKLKEKNFD
jgi:hypothetical protein